MREDIKKYIEPIFDEHIKTLVFDYYMIRSTFGHTKAVAELEFKHSGGAVANYYTSSVLLGKMDETEGVNCLKELEKLQIKDSEHPQYGGFLWYREETFIDDSNATFFTLAPLATLALCKPELIPATHREIIEKMLGRSTNWFKHECENPKIYYPNKIVSDGALLLAISAITKNEKALKAGNSFFKRWLDYTDNRGWGWGENTSPSYLNVILDAFQLALKSWNGRETELENRLNSRRQEILDYVLFHGGRMFVPSIRSYSFGSPIVKPSLANLLVGVRECESDIMQHDNPFAFIKNAVLYDDILPNQELKFTDDIMELSEKVKKLPVPRTRNEHIFDEAYAYTWIGKNCRAGSINHFPVMPGMYQHPTWGIGWQSTPVSFLVEDAQTSFLRFAVREGENFRAHHAGAFGKAYLNPALFSEECLPLVETHCAQKDNVMIAQRMMKNLSNSASEIMDEWYVKGFKGKIHKVPANVSVKWTSMISVTHSVPQTVESEYSPDWTVLEFDNCYVAIMALGYIPVGSKIGTASEIEINQGEDLTISRALYRGEEAYLRQHIVDNAWVTVMFDEKVSLEELKKELEKYEVLDQRVNDFEVPRDDMFMIREIMVETPKGEVLTFRHDPYKSIG